MPKWKRTHINAIKLKKSNLHFKAEPEGHSCWTVLSISTKIGQKCFDASLLRHRVARDFKRETTFLSQFFPLENGFGRERVAEKGASSVFVQTA